MMLETQIIITAKTSLSTDSLRNSFQCMSETFFENFDVSVKRVREVSKDDIDTVYKSYPSKCIVSGRNLGKSHKDKNRIKTLLQNKSKTELVDIIQKYIEECREDKVYMKNFSTFLNNLPDYEFSEVTDNVDVATNVMPVNNGGYRNFRQIEDLQ